jgi:3-isopropylmalate/(R)-2-methylmalate dehydratase small subunit
MIIEGRVAWIFPDNFDPDFIVGVENIATLDIEVLKCATMNKFETDFTEKVQKGDILIGGRNFGYGHPHPQAMRAMRAWGVKVVIAESFFHVFYRGELASGSHLFVSPKITQNVNRWDELYLDTDRAVFLNKTKGLELAFESIGKYPLYLMEHGTVEFIKAIQLGKIS